MAATLIARMQSFPIETLGAIEKALAAPRTDEPIRMTATLTFEIANEDGYNRAWDRARRQLNI